MAGVSKAGVEGVFGGYGPLLSVRVCSGKPYAFVAYANVRAAAAAKADLDGRCVPGISGTKPLLLRYHNKGPRAEGAEGDASPTACAAPANAWEARAEARALLNAPTPRAGGTATATVPARAPDTLQPTPWSLQPPHQGLQ